MVNSTEFAKRLQKILDYYGLSATAFSDLIAFNRSTISHLLSGRNKPSLEFVLKVLEQFPEVELYWLLNGKGSFPIEYVHEVKRNEELDTPISTPVKIPQIESHVDQTPPNLHSSEEEKGIDRIVIFYKDGTFKSYR